MAKIDNLVSKIRAAIYGKDVRESIALSIEAINEESTAAKKSAADSAESAAQSAAEAVTASGAAASAVDKSKEIMELAGAAAENANTQAQAAKDAAVEALNQTQYSREVTAATLEAGTSATEATKAAEAATNEAQTQAAYAKEQGGRVEQLVADGIDAHNHSADSHPELLAVLQEAEAVVEDSRAVAEKALRITNALIYGVPATPTQKGTLTYTGEALTPVWDGYDPEYLDISGDTAATDAGTYSVTFKPKGRFIWADGSSEPRSAVWSIRKAPATLTVNTKVIELSKNYARATISADCSGTGVLIAVSDNPTVTVTISGHQITVNRTSEEDGTATVTVSSAENDNFFASEEKSVSVINRAPNIWGIETNADSSDLQTLRRTNGAKNFATPKPAVSGGSGRSPFDNYYPWSGMTRVTDEEAGELVAIPKFWYRLTQDGDDVKIQIADGPTAGFSVSPAHMERGDGKGERDVVYIGRYHCGPDYKSQTKAFPINEINLGTARTKIHELGETIWQSDFAMRMTIWLLYIVEFADWNSQLAIGYGCGGKDSNNIRLNGISDSIGYHTGTAAESRTTYTVGVQYRNIEGLWSNGLDFCDGCYCTEEGFFIILNPEAFNSDKTGGDLIGKPGNFGKSSGYYPEILKISNDGPFPLFYGVSGSGYAGEKKNCNIPDYWRFTGKEGEFCVGGAPLSGSNYYGLFYMYETAGKSFHTSCRLMKLP